MTDTFYLYDVIVDDSSAGGVSPKDLVDWLNGLDASVTDITIRVNSPGGSVFAARTMEQHLRESERNITTYIDGVAASAATYIALAADTVYIAEGAFVMIHRANAVAAGNAEDLTKTAGLLLKIDETLINTYSAKTGLSVDDIKSMLDAETWLNADEAIALKFADIISDTKQSKPRNQANWSATNLASFKNTPDMVKQALAPVTNETNIPPVEPAETLEPSETTEPAAATNSNKPDVAYLLRKLDIATRSI